MGYYRTDPGPCGICGAAHCACTADAGPIAIPQLPARDATPPTPITAPLKAEQVQATLPEGQVTTGTYRRGRKK